MSEAWGVLITVTVPTATPEPAEAERALKGQGAWVKVQGALRTTGVRGLSLSFRCRWVGAVESELIFEFRFHNLSLGKLISPVATVIQFNNYLPINKRSRN